MKYYLICIGGTGAKCLEAFVHMNAAGLMQNREEIKIIYVDPDASNGNLEKAKKAVASYINAYNVMSQDKEFFKNPLSPKGVTWNPVPDGSSRNLEEIFQRSNMIGDEEAIACLFDVLFTKSERTTKLNVGFRGHPSIGAAVIGLNMDMNKADVWKEMADDIKEKEARIFFFGSVFGGTGAAGFPNIAKIIRGAFDGKTGPDFKMGGCLMLPYFEFEPAKKDDEIDNETKDEIIVPKPTRFKASTYAALNYYNKNFLLGNPSENESGVFDAIYLLGDVAPVHMGSYHDGGDSQKNDPHFLEMLAALAAIDFFNKESAAFDKPICNMLALQGEDFTWKDLPSVYPGCDTGIKIKTFIRMAYMFRTTIFPKIKENYNNNIAIGKIKNDPWIENWLRGNQSILQRLFNNNKSNSEKSSYITKDEYTSLEFFQKYCVMFLDDWLKGFTFQQKNKRLRCGNLINEGFFAYGKRSEEDDDDEKTFADNIGKIIRPENIFKEKGTTIFDTTQEEFHQALIRWSETNNKETGVKYLLAQVYDLLKDGKEGNK